MSDCKKKVFAEGLRKMLSGYNSKKIKLENINPDILEDHLSYFDSYTLSEVSEHFSKKYPERMTGDLWMKRFEQIVKSVDYPELRKFTGANHYSMNPKLASLYFDALETLKKSGKIDLNWTEIFEKFKDKIESNKYIGPILVPVICSKTFREDPESAKNFMYDVNFKKLKAKVRTSYYQAYIKAGLLDKKIARRIRSDGAERTSRDAIECFLDNLDLYENPKALLTQFTDIKHELSQSLMAKKAPDYMVPFMMGFDYPHAKKVLEQRAMALTKAKEKES